MNKPKIHIASLLLMYISFLFYGALFPFQGWRVPVDPIISIVLYGWLDHIFLFDIVQNLLLFLPFGLFAGGYLILQKRRALNVIFLATLASFLLSVCIEVLQTYNPARIPSLLDILLNMISGFLGGLIALPLMPFYPKVIKFVDESTQKGSRQNLWPLLGVTVWLAWGCYQLFPFIPTLHPKQLLQSVLPIYLFFKREIPFYPVRFCHYSLQAMMLYFSGKLFLKQHRFLPILVSFICIIYFAKMASVGRLLSIEMILGCTTAIGLLALGHKFLSSRPFESELSLRVRQLE